MNNVTFIIFTYNEERRLPYTIRNFIDYGTVVILDGGSTDNTKDIAEKMGAKFFTRPINTANVEHQENLDFIKNKIDTDWIYWGYVDNIAPKTLVEKIVEIANKNEAKFVNIPMHTYMWGNTENCVLKSHGPFLFHKDYVDFSNNYIHGFGKFLGSKKENIFLENNEKYTLKHFSTYNINKFVNGHLKYAEYEAGEKYQRGEKFSVIKMLLAMLRYCWIYRRSLKNLKLGLIIILGYSFFRLMTYAKLYELENSITIDSIENNYGKSKEKILEAFNN